MVEKARKWPDTGLVSVHTFMVVAKNTAELRDFWGELPKGLSNPVHCGLGGAAGED